MTRPAVPSGPRHRGGRRLVLGAVAAIALTACTADPDDPGPSAGPGDELEGVVLADAMTGPIELEVPPGTAAWTVGDTLEPLEEVAAGSAWWAFWEPRLAPLDPQVSNIRAMLAIPAGGQVRSVQINVAAYDLDVEPGDAEGIAEVFALVAQAQGSEVLEQRPVTYHGALLDEVAQVVHRVDPEVLARDVWQRFVPVPDADALWSVQCDGPAGASPEPDADLAAMCEAVLDTFRPPE